MFAVPSLKNGPVVVASLYKKPKPVLVSAMISPLMFGREPNITGKLESGNLYAWWGEKSSSEGAFSVETHGVNSVEGNVWQTAVNVLRFSASDGNGIYGKSTLVQPASVCLLPCIKI